MRKVAIKVIVEQIHSERDVNGNVYTLARFWSPKRGRQQMMQLYDDGKNARHIAYDMFKDWEAVLAFETWIPKRDWQRLNNSSHWAYYNQEFAADLCKFFGVPSSRLLDRWN